MKRYQIRLPAAQEELMVRYCNRTRIPGLFLMYLTSVGALGVTPFALHDLYMLTNGAYGTSLLERSAMLLTLSLRYHRYYPGRLLTLWFCLVTAAAVSSIVLRGKVYGKMCDYRCIKDGRYETGYITLSGKQHDSGSPPYIVYDEEGELYPCILHSDYNKVSYGGQMLVVFLENGHRYAMLDDDHPELWLEDE